MGASSHHFSATPFAMRYTTAWHGADSGRFRAAGLGALTASDDSFGGFSDREGVATLLRSRAIYQNVLICRIVSFCLLSRALTPPLSTTNPTARPFCISRKPQLAQMRRGEEVLDLKTNVALSWR